MFKKYSLIILLLALFSFLIADPASITNPKLEIEQGKSEVLKVKVLIPEGQHMTLQPDYFYVDIDSLPGISSAQTVYPDGQKKDDLGNWVYYKEVEVTKSISVSNDLKPGDYKLTIRVGHQFCNEEGSCLLPEEQVIEYNLTVKEGAGFNYSDLIKFLLLAFIGGVILNIMPCVLPVLSIKALSIVKQSHQDKKDILKHSLAYTFGILLSFLILSIVVIIIKLSGEMVGWGFQFQNPSFVLVLYSVMFVFALSMFDVFIFQAPGMSMAYQASGKSGYSGSFMSGIFAVVLATPCTAPFLGAALGFAFSQPPLIIFAIFMLIGLGLAFPFLLIGFFPNSIKIFPKPGEWMNIFKECMGFLLLATAVWLLNVVYTQLGGSNTIRVLFFTVVLAFAAWMYGRFVKPNYSKAFQWIMTLVAILSIVIGAYFLLQFKEAPAEASTTTEAATDDMWKKFDETEVNQMIAEGKPVFVDFTAQWCMTCKSNETTVLWTDEVKNAFQKKGVTLYKGDYTKKDPTIHTWLKKFKKAGVPLYLLYIPGQTEPVVFPEIITKGMVLDKLNLLPDAVSADSSATPDSAQVN
jgi:thiol:disulfide interchange protein DsbD